jgi:hypothetical protein
MKKLPINRRRLYFLIVGTSYIFLVFVIASLTTLMAIRLHTPIKPVAVADYIIRSLGQGPIVDVRTSNFGASMCAQFSGFEPNQLGIWPGTDAYCKEDYPYESISSSQRLLRGGVPRGNGKRCSTCKYTCSKYQKSEPMR